MAQRPRPFSPKNKNFTPKYIHRWPLHRTETSIHCREPKAATKLPLPPPSSAPPPSASISPLLAAISLLRHHHNHPRSPPQSKYCQDRTKLPICQQQPARVKTEKQQPHNHQKPPPSFCNRRTSEHRRNPLLLGKTTPSKNGAVGKRRATAQPRERTHYCWVKPITPRRGSVGNPKPPDQRSDRWGEGG